MTTKTTYDLSVAYRIYPKVAKPAATLPCAGDKYLLAEICLRSFKRALGPLRAKLWVLLDSCPPHYAQLFRRYFTDEDLVLIPLNGAGNHATFGLQLDILTRQNDASVVYFAEDDYFYLPGQFPGLINFLSRNPDADFVSPHDHLDYYTLDFQRGRSWIRADGDRHWRTATSTCLTFLTRKQTLVQTEAVFRTYQRRNFDSSLWLSLTKHAVLSPWAFVRFASRQPFFCKVILKAWLYGWRQILFGRRRSLWVPLPAAATHLDAAALAPTINWLDLIKHEADSVEQHAQL